MKENIKGQKAITLVALIITIVILMILAVVALTSIQKSDIIGKAETAKGMWNNSVQNESTIIDKYENFLDNNETVIENVEDFVVTLRFGSYIGEPDERIHVEGCESLMITYPYVTVKKGETRRVSDSWGEEGLWISPTGFGHYEDAVLIPTDITFNSDVYYIWSQYEYPLNS